MSTGNITCTTTHPQLHACKILFVWHQCFIVKSSGKISWRTHRQTHKQTEGENITSLSRVIKTRRGENHVHMSCEVYVALSVKCQSPSCVKYHSAKSCHFNNEIITPRQRNHDDIASKRRFRVTITSWMRWKMACIKTRMPAFYDDIF